MVEDEAGLIGVRAGGTAGPIEEFGLARVGREAANGVDLGADGDGFAEDADHGCAFDEFAAEGAVGLVADDDDVDALAPEVVLEVVKDAAAGAHARAGDHDGGALMVVDGFGLFGGGGEAGVLVIEEEAVVAQDGLGFVVEQARIRAVELAGFVGHGAIEEDGEPGHAAGLGEFAKEVEHGLCAADGEGGDEDLLFLPDCFFDDGGEFVDGLGEWAVVAVAVG